MTATSMTSTFTQSTLPDQQLADQRLATAGEQTTVIPSGSQMPPPPTERGRTSPDAKVQAAWAAARRAVGYAAEQVPPDRGGRCLIADAGGDALVLDLAGDYLSFSTVTDNLYQQVRALFMVEEAQRLLPDLARRQAWRDRLGRMLGRTAPQRQAGAADRTTPEMTGVGQ